MATPVEKGTLKTIENKPTTTVRVITTSPLAKVFTPYAKIDKYLEDPELVYKEESKPFTVMVQSSWATREFETGKPYMIDSGVAEALLGPSNDRLDYRDLGGTGLVYFDVPNDVQAALEYNKATGEKLPPHIETKLVEAMERIKELSHKRVLSHAKHLYNTMIAGRNTMKEHGKQPHQPNDMELLIAYILKEEIKRAKEKRAKLTEMFEGAVSDIGGDINNLL